MRLLWLFPTHKAQRGRLCLAAGAAALLSLMAPPAPAQSKGSLPGSSFVESLAENLDQRLAGSGDSARPNQTAVRVENATVWTEGGLVQNRWHLGVDLHLPNLEENWAVKFGTYDEREEERRLDQRIFRRTPREESPGARLSLFKAFDQTQVSFEPRIEFQDPPGMSYILRVKTQAEVERYTWRPRVELFARHERGTGVFASLHTAYRIHDKLQLHILNEGEYQDHENLFTSNSGLSWTRSLSRNMSLSYGFAFHSFNRPAYHLVQYGPSVSWDVFFLKDTVRSSLSPFMIFHEEQQFKGAPGLQYTLTAVF